MIKLNKYRIFFVLPTLNNVSKHIHVEKSKIFKELSFSDELRLWIDFDHPFHNFSFGFSCPIEIFRLLIIILEFHFFFKFLNLFFEIDNTAFRDLCLVLLFCLNLREATIVYMYNAIVSASNKTSFNGKDFGEADIFQHYQLCFFSERPDS